MVVFYGDAEMSQRHHTDLMRKFLVFTRFCGRERGNSQLPSIKTNKDQKRSLLEISAKFFHVGLNKKVFISNLNLYLLTDDHSK